MAKRNQKALNLFGKKIIALRKEKGLSQYQLADEADIYRSRIISIENGIANPTLNTILAIAVALEVKPKDLLDF